ncbi:MAG: protein translocase SEC61 complex subunit gamma [Desulfurococcaceae archaeon]
MSLRELIDMWKRILQIASKPDRSEYFTLLKVTLLGLFIIGLIAFIIRVLFYTFLYPYTG